MKFKYKCVSLILVLLGGCNESISPTELKNRPQIELTCQSAVPTPIKLTGGQVVIGSNKAYPEERPRRATQINPFEIDASEITNKQFMSFVEETGFITDAEKPQAGFGGPGGAVFSFPTPQNRSWWRFVEGANWKHPEGPDSTIKGKELHPVVQVTLNDAKAYAKWAGRRLPTEEEWEFAAKAGSDFIYVWGNELTPNEEEKANTWQGAFPIENTEDDGFGSRAPIGCFEPNKFGLYDMIGNVWEWTETEWENKQSHVIKGGSFLCAENYCRRYRASARQGQESNFPTNHIGFRTVK